MLLAKAIALMALKTTSPTIVSDSEILGGTPVFNGTRVPVQNLLDYLSEGHDLDEFLDDFPSVQKRQAQEVILLLGRDLERFAA